VKGLLGKEATLTGEMKESRRKTACLHPVKNSGNFITCHAQKRGDEDLGTEEIVLKSQKSMREEAVVNSTG